MARITVEDCLEKINNRFNLVLIASQRARKLASGEEEALVPWEKDKPPVVALREIAAGHHVHFLTQDAHAEDKEH